MAQLIFQTNGGGNTVLSAINASVNHLINVPALDGTLVIQDSTNTVNITNLSVSGTTALTGLTSTADGTFSGTGQLKIPVGSTSQRSGTPANGMIRYNSQIGKYEGYSVSSWASLGGGATGGGADEIFVENGQTVTTSYTIPTLKNAMSTGPISINSGVDVTVPDGSVWVVL